MTTTATQDAPPGQRSQRSALLVLGAVALLVVGFAIGFLAQTPLRDDAAPNPGADSVDVGFSQDMTVHHNQAIEMATLALSGASDPLVKNLAYDILTTQQNQAGQMQGWLALWDAAPLPTGGYMGWMTDDGGHSMSGMGGSSMTGPVQTMPGMASTQDMTDLRAASGPALDVLFLQLMLRHHQGGLTMMQYGEVHAETPAVRNLARTMVNTQTSEAQLMTQMLTEKGAAPL
ncbi:hypothetical protein ASG56_09585 [Rhodococcus sp. Leaf7]|uniref:DUF305 domain-containing protein n=1 Tax=unclassified Rhodococcus (in: high G+C Gram-positive bacteria) TaxID=192944 RepID=UPI0006FB78B6|nr:MULTISPECIES: DUF305 domain-containing protein [unclassified Rhodococcus (in: high G+C Gram-positive bacteria)]KQU03732.1 hypothetical protein ASG56_09585 [Rhodococcus sp. Leaf7]KQU39918.1 hypothetical protein ASG64_09580 [Rhodococcus sp. Leaf247]